VAFGPCRPPISSCRHQSTFVHPLR
jgi:hypothetical protein